MFFRGSRGMDHIATNVEQETMGEEKVAKE
jgi:hypothetical protein